MVGHWRGGIVSVFKRHHYRRTRIVFIWCSIMISAVCNISINQAAREKLQKDLELYLKQGGKIQEVASGVCALAEDGCVQTTTQKQLRKGKNRGPSITITRGGAND